MKDDMKGKWEKGGLLAGGILIGTAGVRLLSSKDAKKVYTHTAAALMRAKEVVMTVVTKAKENAGDIVVDAREINAVRAYEEETYVEDASSEKEKAGK